MATSQRPGRPAVEPGPETGPGKKKNSKKSGPARGRARARGAPSRGQKKGVLFFAPSPPRGAGRVAARAKIFFPKIFHI